jgi:CNT family concentrative nucleoside transporter
MQPADADPPELADVAPPHTPDRTPLAWRIGLLGAFLALTSLAYVLQTSIGPKATAVIGCVAFFVLAAAASTDILRVRWRTVVGGILLQFALAVLVIHGSVTLGGTVYSVRGVFEALGEVVKAFIGFSDEGARFVFGNLANPGDIALNPGKEFLFMFAFKALPPILFVSAFFTVLYHYGVLQGIVRLFARVMVFVLGTSGAETLSVAANVFMGQTEAPLIVKPYVPRMTRSELFTLMVSGFAHISGGMMAVYINYGADPVAVLTTCVMACPCSLYLAKLIYPETTTPETSGLTPHTEIKSPYVNAVDAAAAGAADGLRLALNVAAMLIVFIAFVAMFDGLLGTVKPLLGWLHLPAAWIPDGLSLKMIFGWLFAPAAMLMGVEPADQQKVGALLGAKLSINEHYAYLQMKKLLADAAMQPRSFELAAYALTGFANFASVGIQIGGIGAIAPSRRHDLAKLGGRALFAGFLATLLNAAIAGVLTSR